MREHAAGVHDVKSDCTVEVDMSDVHAPDDLPYEDSKQGAWADVLGTLAGVLLLMSSGFWLLQGLAAVADDEFYANGTEYLYKINVTAWGWFHVVMAVVTCVVSIGILLRRSWGQALGVVVVVVSMITNFAFLPQYPLWAITIIVLDVLIAWALCTQFANNP